MNRKTVIALAAAGVIVAGGVAAFLWMGRDTAPAEPTPPVTSVPVETETPAPSDTPLPEVTVLPTETPETEPTPEATEPVATPKPTEKPAATPKPTAAPTPKPTPAPTPSAPVATPTPKPETSAVQSVWNEIAKGDLPSLSDVDAATLKDLYGISSSDVSEFICKMPMMSANIHEFFIAKVADGKMDTVKAACETRQKNLAGGFLYPSQTELVNNYKIVTSGNYILFCITDDTDAAIKAFNTFAK